MINDFNDDSVSGSKVSVVSGSSFIECPFQLTENNYLEKIDFIKSSVHGINSVEENYVEDVEASQREFNSNFASMQSWFIRVSHKEKLNFVLELLSIFSVVLKRSTNVLLDILGPVPKDFIYAKTQFTFSKYDMTPLDNDRCLTNIPLAEAKTNSLSWFTDLQEKEQVRVMLILLTISGSAITYSFYFKAVKYLDRNFKYDPAAIERKFNDYNFYTSMMNEEDPIDLLFHDSKSELNPSQDSSHVSSQKSLENLETKTVENVMNMASVMSTVSKNSSSVLYDYQDKLEEWERDFKELLNISGILKPENLSDIGAPVIDMLQLLPISVNRYIFTLLENRSRKHLRSINKYWFKSAPVIHKEELTRHWLDQTIKMLEFKLFKYKAKDFYSEAKYVHPKMHDKDNSLSDQETRRKSSKRSTIISINELKRSVSAPSVIESELFLPKYSIKMIPDPNHQYTDMYPKNPYNGRYIISEIFSGFDHTRCIAANFQWLIMSDKNNITLLSLLTGAPNPCQIVGHTGYITVLCFHPSKNCFFSGSSDTTIKYWDIYSRKVIATYTNHKSLITDIGVNENYLASTSMDQTLRIFKTDTCYLMWQYIFTCCPFALALCSKLEVYLGFEDGSVFKSDLEASPNPAEWEITRAHAKRITCILFDEPFVITGSSDGFVRAWHFEHFDASAVATFNHDGLCITGIGLSFMKVLTSAIDGILRIWDMYDSRLTREIVVNIARTPILSMICMEIYDHTKVILNSEDGIKVIEFPFHWINFTRACLLKDNKEPRFIRRVTRINTTLPDEVLDPTSHLKMNTKFRLEERCRKRLLLRHAALPALVRPTLGDKVSLRDVPIFSRALEDNDLLLFPRIIPGSMKIVPKAIKSEVLDRGSKVLNSLWKYLPRSTKGVLPGYNPSKRTI